MPGGGGGKPGDDEVAAQGLRLEGVRSRQGGDNRQMLGLDQRHGPFAGAGVIAREAGFGDLGALDMEKARASRGPQSSGLQAQVLLTRLAES